MSKQVNLLELSHGFIVSQCISIAAQLKLHNILTKSMTCDEIAIKTKTYAPALKLLLDVLLAYDILEKNEKDEYMPTSSLKQLDLIISLYNGDIAFNVWENAMNAIKTGEPAWNKKFGKNFYATLDDMPDLSKKFHEWNTKTGKAWLESLITQYDFSQFQTFVDIGGGEGILTGFLLSRIPQLKGFILDRHDAKPSALQYLNSLNVIDRCKFISGNFFIEVPSGLDAYCFSRVLLNFSDEDIIKILTTCRKAMSNSSKLLIIDALITDVSDPNYTFAALNNINLFMLMKGGRRNIQQWEELLKAAGLRITEFKPSISVYGMCLIESIFLFV